MRIIFSQILMNIPPFPYSQFFVFIYDFTSTLHTAYFELGVYTGVHLGFSDGRGPNFRKEANQYKTKKKQI